MTPTDFAWRAIRQAKGTGQIVRLANEWLDLLWTERGHAAKRSVPPIVIGKMNIKESVGQFSPHFWRIKVPESRELRKAMFSAFSPALHGFVLEPDPGDYLRTIVTHESVHALDYMDGRDIYRHDKRFFGRMAAFEQRFNPLSTWRSVG